MALPFDDDWRFLQADAPGAQAHAYADSGWRVVRVPYDWSIAGPFDAANPTGGAGAFLPAGVGWYRKRFTLPSEDAGQRVVVEFDGVMANSTVWINGVSIGGHPYGYVSFRCDLTDHLHFGLTPNVLAVRVDDAPQPASRWYAGAGINRHVRLVVTDPIHIAPDSVFVTTPRADASGATVDIRGAIANDSPKGRAVAVQIELDGPDGRAVATAEAPTPPTDAGKTTTFEQTIPVPAPQLWDIDHPVLYSARVVLRAQNQTLDDQRVPFGIRAFRFDPATGFWLNGRNLKLKGVCLHGDMGALGTAVPASALRRRLALLKTVGCNAIRTSHNPPAPELLDLCDRMGFLVMDELFDCWTVGKNPYDYHLYFAQWSGRDIADTVRRDRNHPSIVLYSAGNEIRDTTHAVEAKQTLGALLAAFHENDPTRPVTMALFRPNASHDYDDGLADMLDVIGQNYRERELLAAHAAQPTRKIVGTENGHDRATWVALRDHPEYAGQFLWTGFDYLGEARAWPTIGASAGLFDRTGAPHERAWERQSWWSDAPMVHIARRVAASRATPDDPGFTPLLQRQAPLVSDWTPTDLGPHEERVEVYSNCAQVQLTLNGKPVGEPQARPADAGPRTWRVDFTPGTLAAVGMNDGATVARAELRTAGKPAKIQLTTDRAEALTPAWDDVAYVTATIVDAVGTPIPMAADTIDWTLSGPGTIAAVDNADNNSHEPFQATRRRAYEGRCVAIVRANALGTITLTATAPNLAGGTLVLPTGASKETP